MLDRAAGFSYVSFTSFFFREAEFWTSKQLHVATLSTAVSLFCDAWSFLPVVGGQAQLPATSEPTFATATLENVGGQLFNSTTNKLPILVQ